MSRHQTPDPDTRVTRRQALARGASAGLAAYAAMAGHGSLLQAAGQSPGRGAVRGRVQTVLGPIETARLGFVLSHEHIAIGAPGLWQTWPELFGGRTAFVRATVETLKRAKDAGVDTIIDVTTLDLGRDVRLLEEVSRKSGVHLIASTGHWLDPSRAFNARTVEELATFFVREIQSGIDGTGIKPGIIKVANANARIEGFGDRVLRAAARASKATGVPITTHAPPEDRTGERQAAIFESEGLAPGRVCLGHSDNSAEDYRMGLARRGYYLGMDNLPRGNPTPEGMPMAQPKGLSFAERMAAIKGLVDAGFGDRVMLGSDHSLAMAFLPTDVEQRRIATSGEGILFVPRRAVPALKAIGVSDAAIRAMTVEAYRRFFDDAAAGA